MLNDPIGQSAFEANIEARLWIGNTSDLFGSAMDSAKQTPQDESGRLWDVVFMAAHAVRAQTGGSAQLLYDLARVPRDGEVGQAVTTTLKLIVAPGDGGEPVVTIVLPDEDSAATLNCEKLPTCAGRLAATARCADTYERGRRPLQAWFRRSGVKPAF